MDRPPRKSRRSSILKVRQTEVVSEKVTVEDDTNKQVMKRRVSFHNVKTVQNFEKDNLNLLDGSPFREKIQETMSSDGILTPGKGHITPTPPPDTDDHLEASTFLDSTMMCFEEGPQRIQRLDHGDVTKYTSADMSICDTTVRQEAISPIDMSLCQTTLNEQPVSSQPSPGQPDSTQYSSVDMSFCTTVTGSSDDTLAALEAPCRRVSSSHDRQSMGGGIADSTVDVSRRTTNDTFACLNIEPGQPSHGLQTPRCSQSISNKSSISTFDDDTALILETGNAFGNEGRNQQCNTASNNSSFMSESVDVGDTMRVFECLMPKAAVGDFEEPNRSHEMQISVAESTLLNSTNMEVTDWILRESVNEVHRIAQAHQSSVDIEPPTEAVIHNSTFVVESPLHNAALSDDVADELKQECDVGMDIVDETINLVTSETSFCAGDKLSTSEICTTHSSSPQRSEMLSTGDDSIQCPSPPANTTITLETETRTTATKEKTGTINLFTTPDKSMVSMRQEDSVLLKSRLSPAGCSEEEGRHLSTVTTQDATECEALEIQRRAEVSCYPVEDHFASEALLQSKIADRSTASEVTTALERDEEMDVTVVDERNSLLEDIASSTVHHESMEDVQEQNYSVQTENLDKTAALAETMRTLDGNMENSVVSVDRRSSATTYSINESLNDANITRRDVSIMQIGSRFRPSTSSRDETLLSLRSLRDETICLSERIMFDSQSLQVKYLDPADDQPQSNLIREEISNDLQRKLIEVKEKSAAEFNEMLPKLHAVDPTKATAVKNMDMRALSLDDADLLMCSRMRAEIEWAQARTRVAEEAKSVVEQLLKNDEPLLKQLEEDAQRCRSVDQLQREVDALRVELDSLPSAEEALRIIEQSEQAAKEEEDLDDRILDLEIEELRLELELAKLRGQEIRRTNAELNEWACQLERNEARVRTLTREIQNFHAVGQGDSRTSVA